MNAPLSGWSENVHAPRTAGLILLNRTGTPIYYNSEAIAILNYPRHSKNPEKAADLIPYEIHALLLRLRTSRNILGAAEFTSGKRRYVGRAFALSHNSGTLSKGMTGVLIERVTQKMLCASDAAERFHLTRREQETVGLLTLGLTSKEIATRMNISPNTVKTFFRLVMTKMSVSTRSGIVGKIARL